MGLEVLTPGRILLRCLGHAAFGGFCKHHSRSLQTRHTPWDVVERVEHRYVGAYQICYGRLIATQRRL
jgi:hypothetical protein